jgi:hypothetical protein
MKKIIMLNILAAGLLASFAKAGEPAGAEEIKIDFDGKI